MEVFTIKEKIIIDTDIGDDIDDALAIAMAVNSPEFEILGITTVFRNTKARARLAVRLLKEMGREDIPVAAGIGVTFANGPVDTLFKFIDLNEKLGQYSDDMDDEQITYEGHGIDFIENTLMESSEAITLVSIGPLTNIAALIIKNEFAKSKIKRIVLMGGAYNLNKAEYNILCDPEAARVVFDSGIDIVGVGLDVTTKWQLTEEEVEVIEKADTPTSRFIFKLISRFMGYAHHLPYLHDPLALITCFDKSVVKTEMKRIAVETRGEFTRGMTFNITNSRWWEDNKNSGNIEVCTEVDRDRVVRLFLQRVTR